MSVDYEAECKLRNYMTVLRYAMNQVEQACEHEGRVLDASLLEMIVSVVSYFYFEARDMTTEEVTKYLLACGMFGIESEVVYFIGAINPSSISISLEAFH